MAVYTQIDDPSAHFKVQLYTGNASTQSITFDDTDTDLQPDLLWIKCRGAAENHTIVDSVRGDSTENSGYKYLQANTTSAEQAHSGNTLVDAITSDGFNIGNNDQVNIAQPFVAWAWKAGTSFSNDASATSVGTIDSTGSINTDAGISIMSWTSLASGSNYTIAHGISTPAVIIMKGRHESNSWQVYHHKNTSAPETDYLDLSTDDATADYTVWNDTAPTSSVMSLGTWSGLDDGGTMIAYLFAEKQGFSKFGGYTGNGNTDGTFVYTGFRPAFVMFKCTSASDKWSIFDNKRDVDNPTELYLRANIADAEGSHATKKADFLSNGFKPRTTSQEWNGDGQSYIYMAFAEAPFVTGSGGVPCNAR